MEDREILTIPYIVLESERARHERERKDERTKWFIVVIVLLLLLFGTNAAWINYESQFVDEEVAQEVWQDADNGINRFVGGDYYSYAESEDYGQETSPQVRR